MFRCVFWVCSLAASRGQSPNWEKLETGGLRLSPGENVLQIDYTDLAFGAAGELRFQYLLDGSPQGWSVPTKDQRCILPVWRRVLTSCPCAL